MKYVLMVLMFVTTACSMVGPGELGVRSSFGSVSSDAKNPGLYLWLPFALGMNKIDVQIQKSDVESTAATKDMQDVHAHVAVNWSMNASNVVHTYTSIGDESAVLERIITPAVNEVMKSSTSKRTAEEVLTKRMEMKADIDKGLQDRLATYGIKLYDVSIVNLKFSDEFTHAVEKKQVAEQAAKQAVYEAQSATQEANAEIERAKGQAKAQELVRTTLTPLILQQRAIEKWNGAFPQVMGSQTLPFLNLKLDHKE